jgi:SAM-dependent methyltransferase
MLLWAVGKDVRKTAGKWPPQNRALRFTVRRREELDRCMSLRSRIAGTRWGSELRRLWKGRTHPLAIREELASRFLRGEGIEIGALHLPLRLPRTARVRYVDRFSVPDLLTHYPDLAGTRLVPVHVVDDGETLATFAPASLDFIIANHFLEHTQNTLGVLARFLECLREGGVLFMAVPDKRGTFDRDRPLTPVEHLYGDRHDGGAASYDGHVREFVRLVQHFPEPEVEAQVRNITRSGYSIHFHVWTLDSLLESLLDARRTLRLPFEVLAVVRNEPMSEAVVVLRRTASSA